MLGSSVCSRHFADDVQPVDGLLKFMLAEACWLLTFGAFTGVLSLLCRCRFGRLRRNSFISFCLTFAALAANTAALAAFAADVASQLGFVGLGVRCFAFRDLQSHCRRAHGHRFHSLPSFAATTASFFWDSGGFWSLRVFVSPRTRPSWPW